MLIQRWKQYFVTSYNVRLPLTIQIRPCMVLLKYFTSRDPFLRLFAPQIIHLVHGWQNDWRLCNSLKWEPASVPQTCNVFKEVGFSPFKQPVSVFNFAYCSAAICRSYWTTKWSIRLHCAYCSSYEVVALIWRVQKGRTPFVMSTVFKLAKRIHSLGHRIHDECQLSLNKMDLDMATTANFGPQLCQLICKCAPSPPGH